MIRTFARVAAFAFGVPRDVLRRGDAEAEARAYAAEAFADVEAETEVWTKPLGPRAFGDLTVMNEDGTSRTIPAGEWHFCSGDDDCGQCWLDKAPDALQGAVEERLGRELPPTLPSEAPLTWEGWALPAIFDVLATHEPRFIEQSGYVDCCQNEQGFSTRALPSWQDWREHVAPIIAARIACDPARAAAALATYKPKER